VPDARGSPEARTGEGYAMGQKMRAVVIRRYGSPDVLETLGLEIGEAGTGA
jgi:hypothetical protein